MNKKYVFRGGVLGFVFPLVIMLLVLVVPYPTNKIFALFSVPGNWFGESVVLGVLRGFFCPLDAMCAGEGATFYLLFLTALSHVFIYIVAGAFLGWLYGKMRNRKAGVKTQM